MILPHLLRRILISTPDRILHQIARGFVMFTLLTLRSIFTFIFLTHSALLFAEEKLVLELDLESDLLSMSHHIDGFLFKPTVNSQTGEEKNINNMSYSNLQNHLAATALVRLNENVIGFATEQEVIYVDKETEATMAESMWLLKLNAPGLNGFLTVKQTENALRVMALTQEVIGSRDKEWKDEWQMFLSTEGETLVQYASGDLSVYEGGRFEEYNGINPADFAKLGRFRGRIQFAIYPKD